MALSANSRHCLLTSLTAALFIMFLLIPSIAPVSSLSQRSLAPELGSAIDWSSWASTAWGYYQPGVGVNSATGLHRATLSWICFSDWDLGSYIYATIYARKLSLVTDSGSWQFNDRISKILTFLQKRPLGPNSTPYLAYRWDVMNPYQACPDTGTQLTGAADSGRLLAALYALKNFSPGYAPTVDAVFARSKAAYDMFATQLGTDYYSYLVAEGYAAFGYGELTAFNGLDSYSGSYITVYGQSLPAKSTLSEPIIHVVLEGSTLAHPPSPKFLDFANRVYLAQNGRFLSTGFLTAWSEGAYPNPSYVYEWIIYPKVTSQQWIIGDALLTTTYNVQPIAYTKVAFAYLAIYGENTYIAALVNAVKGLALSCSLASSCGFGEGVFQNGSPAMSSWGNQLGFFSDKTNEFVLAAASFARGSIFDFSVSNSGGVLVTPGGSGSNVITTSLNGGLTQPVSLSITSGLPSGATYSFAPASGSPTFSSILTINTSPTTPTGCYSITVTGSGGGLSRTTQFTLSVSTSSYGSGLSGMGALVVNACAGSVSFVLPDYTGPYHTPAAKCGGVKAAQLSDYSAGGYLLGLLSNPQLQLLDTSPSVSQADCGNPRGVIGTVVTLAGPGVNEVVRYYEQTAALTPVYFLWDGVQNNFVVRATGQRYSLNTAPGIDDFVVEAFTDGSGRHVFTLYGFSWQGTLAAGQFFGAYVYPQLSQFSNSWYIYKWNDASSGNSANSFPDPGDAYALIASSGPPPDLITRTQTGGGTGLPGFAGIANDVFQAAEGSVYFVLPDYNGPYHTTAAKCGGVNAAALSDYSAGGYVLSATTNFQNEILDTSPPISLSVGTCGQFTGTTSVLVTIAGPGANTVVTFYERVASLTPVYYHWDGTKNNFVVRATGQKYTVSAGNTIPGDDLFLLETFTDGPRHVYVIYGFSWQGTLAAATFLNTYVRSHLNQFTNSWYIYEWKDASSGPSDNSFPDQADQFNPISAG